MYHVTLTTPIIGVVCHAKAGTRYRMCAKFDDSSFSRSRDIIRAPKSKMGLVTPTTLHSFIRLLRNTALSRKKSHACAIGCCRLILNL